MGGILRNVKKKKKKSDLGMFPFFLLVRLYWRMFEYHPVFQDCLTQEMDNTCALLFAVCIIQTAVTVSIS